METITLKGAIPAVSRLCMGGCPAGEYGWGNVSRDEVERAMLHAVELGVNFFDTADTYGLGRSEETLGETLHGLRDKVVIATKFGVRVENGKTFYDNSPAYINKALAGSLKRLHTDYVDLYQVHYLDGVTPIPEMMEALIARKEKGDIRAIGLSNITTDQLPALLPYREHIASFQNHFSLAHRDDEPAMRQIADGLTAAPLTWGSLGQGILTGKYGADVHFDANDRRSRTIYDNFYGDKLLKNLRIVEAMRPIAAAHGVPVSSVAVRWILDELPNSVVITGVKSPAQAEANAVALTFSLTPEERETLTEVSR
ncbi:MAG: aldo/keto reductase [Eubacteriales bacterium]|nr:aldo/keto reductase [Eubacteriales bacterium]